MQVDIPGRNPITLQVKMFQPKCYTEVIKIQTQILRIIRPENPRECPILKEGDEKLLSDQPPGLY